MSDSNVVTLRRLQTPQQVLEDALAAGLKHVVVSGIREDGTNYFQADGNSTLKEVV